MRSAAASSSLPKLFWISFNIYFYCFSSFPLLSVFWLAVVATIMIMVRQMEWKEAQKITQTQRNDENNRPKPIGKSWVCGASRRHKTIDFNTRWMGSTNSRCATISIAKPNYTKFQSFNEISFALNRRISLPVLTMQEALLLLLFFFSSYFTFSTFALSLYLIFYFFIHLFVCFNWLKRSQFSHENRFTIEQKKYSK